MKIKDNSFFSLEKIQVVLDSETKKLFEAEFGKNEALIKEFNSQPTYIVTIKNDETKAFMERALKPLKMIMIGPGLFVGESLSYKKTAKELIIISSDINKINGVVESMEAFLKIKTMMLER